jgi:hypothetical protein
MGLGPKLWDLGSRVKKAPDPQHCNFPSVSSQLTFLPIFFSDLLFQVEVEEEQEEYEEEEEGGGGGVGGGVRPPGKVMEQEKRIRREIANSNERRRMQSINAGFSSLRSLLPHHEGIRQDHTKG